MKYRFFLNYSIILRNLWDVTVLSKWISDDAQSDVRWKNIWISEMYPTFLNDSVCKILLILTVFGIDFPFILKKQKQKQSWKLIQFHIQGKWLIVFFKKSYHLSQHCQFHHIFLIIRKTVKINKILCTNAIEKIWIHF